LGKLGDMKVKLTSLDDDNINFFYSTRALEIKYTSKSIKTPFRALTNGDLNAKGNVPSDMPLYSPIAGIHKPLTANKTLQILTENEYPRKLIRSLENLSQQMQHSQVILPIIQPARKAIDDNLKSEKAKDKFLQNLFTIQKLAQLDNICIPWLDYPTKKISGKYQAILESSDDNFIFLIDPRLRPNELAKVSQFFREQIDTGRIHFLGILYQPVENVINSYNVLWEMFKEKDVALMMVDIGRYYQNFNDLSPSHLNEFILGDIFVPRVYSGGGSSDDDKGKAKKKRHVTERLRIFDSNNLTVAPIANYGDDSWLNLVKNEMNEDRILHKLQHYNEAQEDSNKYQILNYISKVHEFLASTKEFKHSQEYIAKEESKAYIEEKATLDSALKSVKGQSKLIC
jgi:hypothetical protein